jgi:hypothetical protein
MVRECFKSWAEFKTSNPNMLQNRGLNRFYYDFVTGFFSGVNNKLRAERDAMNAKMTESEIAALAIIEKGSQTSGVPGL